MKVENLSTISARGSGPANHRLRPAPAFQQRGMRRIRVGTLEEPTHAAAGIALALAISLGLWALVPLGYLLIG